jgi:alginate O-acetyltransferase complex protein AlgI
VAFASALFLFLFLPLVLVGWHALPRRLAVPFLVLCSWLFFAWWRLDFLALLLGATLVTWLAGILVDRARSAGPRSGAARAVLAAGVVLNAGALAFFKYAGFGVATLNSLLAAAHLGPVRGLSVALPVGISFFTFKAISYLVDVYRGTARPAGGLLELAAYVSFFPQVTAGPIERFGAFAGTLAAPERSFAAFSAGAARFLLGFCKKVLIADTVGAIADSAFALPVPRLADSWLGTAAFTMQLYYDFSGYSDMAIGLCGMLGMTCMENFKTPYLSATIGEFWRRWHISLSSWLRDYLYIPLGGSRRGTVRTGVNLFIVMLVGGLWHGSAWTFVLWGAWHGALLVVDRFARDRRGLPRPLGIALTMLSVALGWVLFRASSLAGAGAIYAGMLGLHGGGLSAELGWQVSRLGLVVLALALLLTWAGPWLTGKLGSWKKAAGFLAGREWVALLPLFALGLLKIMSESYAPVLYAKF